jgi:methyl-accepting chemotaxis protein
MVDKVADLTIDVSTNTASVEIGFNKLADIIGQRARDIERSVGGIGSHVESLVAGFRNLAAIAGVSLGAHALVEFVTGIIDAQAHLEDLATKIGTTASEISKLIPAAKLSGTSLDTVATASAKFSRTLIDVQSELGKSVPTTNKAALAFQALGFNAQDAGRFLARRCATLWRPDSSRA